MEGKRVEGSLLRRLILFSRLLPLLAFFPVVAYELIEYFVHHRSFDHIAEELYVYGVLGPVAVWVVLTLFTQQVRERDAVESRLHALYQVSRQIASIREVDSLLDLALRLPGLAGLGAVKTGLMLREHPSGPWTLACADGLTTEEHAAYQATLAHHLHFRCDRCIALNTVAHRDCPLLNSVMFAISDVRHAVMCVPLSKDRPVRALLSIFLPREAEPARAVVETLESMAANVAVALDHARLRERERQMLEQTERAVRQQDGLRSTLYRMLADIAVAHQALYGAVYLFPMEEGAPEATLTAAWPDPELPVDLSPLAHQAVSALDLVVSEVSSLGWRSLAMPLATEGEILGALVLSGPAASIVPDEAVLRSAASMMALVVRNSQLYSRLQSQAVVEEHSRLAAEIHDGVAQALGFLNMKSQQVDRLLAREQWGDAQQALRELRDGAQEAYAEVRLLIEGLRWNEEGGGLVQRLNQIATAYTRQGEMEVSVTVPQILGLAPHAEAHLLRITQEALTNARRHAHARHVWVRVQVREDALTLEVADDGKGMKDGQSKTRERFGLRIIRERVQALNGEFELHSEPGNGTTMRVIVPLSRRKAAPEE